MPESIGQQLKHAREAKRLTLEKAAEATRLRLHYVQALENDDYSVMSSAAQGRGFLRLYAKFLGLDLDEIVSDLKTSAETAPPRDATPAPVADATPEPTSPAQAASASPPDAKAGRSGFWARLLRRAPPAEEPQPQSESQPESLAPAPTEEPAPALASAEAEPVQPARKPRAKRAASAPEPIKKSPRSAAGKKKRSKL
jgi:transcriptional regulator with XRE-family HTH domain